MPQQTTGCSKSKIIMPSNCSSLSQSGHVGGRGRGGRGYGGRSDYGGGYGGGYDSYGGMGGYDDGSGYGAAGAADYSGYAGYGGYGGYTSAGYGAQAPVGMVPMMLPNGQVGLRSSQASCTFCMCPCSSWPFLPASDGRLH